MVMSQSVLAIMEKPKNGEFESNGFCPTYISTISFSNWASASGSPTITYDDTYSPIHQGIYPNTWIN